LELLDQIGDYPFWLKILALGLATFISEDLTTITAGVLASQGTISLATATLGCFLGIFVGDGLLYLVGLWVGKPALRLPVMRNLLTEAQVDQCAHWFERNGLWVVLISRFLPGTRLPTYFAAGLLGSRARYFLLAAAIATAIWTPLLVGVSWFFGQQLMTLFEHGQKYSWIGLILAVGFIFLMVRYGVRLADWRFRRRIRSRLRRFTRFEFWPVGVLYSPLLLYNLWLAARHRRFALPLISNPGIKFSGFVGESKSEIMSAFTGQHEYLAKSTLLPCEWTAAERTQRALDWMAEHALEFPVVLKPDVGQRGAGVTLAKTPRGLQDFFATAKVPIHLQEYAPGPYEAGVLYCRYPDRDHGEIQGLTEKSFPAIVGDGSHDIEELILRHPHVLGRAHIYRKRFHERLHEVLPKGERLALVHNGNHCLGAIFNDGAHLITDALTRRFDAISQALPGFFIGRYDVRFSNLDQFRQGEGFKVIELNGSGSEPGHMYDAGNSLWRAYRILFKFYRELWRIGRINLGRGVKPQPLKVLWRAYRDYVRLSRRYPPSE